MKEDWNQKFLQYVWFITHTKPDRNAVNSKTIKIDRGNQIHSGKIEKSAEEKLNEFQILKSSPLDSLFSRKLRK